MYSGATVKALIGLRTPKKLSLGSQLSTQSGVLHNWSPPHKAMAHGVARRHCELKRGSIKLIVRSDVLLRDLLLRL
jgi:hypothetical protein